MNRHRRWGRLNSEDQRSLEADGQVRCEVPLLDRHGFVED